MHSELGGILCRVKFSFSTIELRIVGAQGSDQGRNRTMAGELAEAALGLEHTGGGPTQNHGAALPAFDPAPDLTHPAEQVFNQVSGRQHPFEIFGQPQAQNGQCFLESLAQRGGGAGILMLEGIPPRIRLLRSKRGKCRQRERIARRILSMHLKLPS